MKKTILFFTFLSLVAFFSCDKVEKDYEKEIDKDAWDKDIDKDKDGKECIKLVYPISYTMPDGTTISGDEQSIESEMKNWYEANPTNEEKPTLNYPVDFINLKTEETETAENEEELIYAKKDCYVGEDMELCTWDESTEASGAEFEKHIVKELVYSDDCDCIVEGYEKFLENGQTRFLIIYGSKDCVGYGFKVTCENGDCKDAEKCKFLQDCEEY